MEKRREANILIIRIIGVCGSKVKKGWFCGTDLWYMLLLFFCWSVFYVCQKCQSEDVRLSFMSIYYEGRKAKQFINSVVLSPWDLRMSTSPAIPRSSVLPHPQEIQQTLNCRHKKSYWVFGKCCEQHWPSPAAKHCSRDRRGTGGNDWQRDVAKHVQL